MIKLRPYQEDFSKNIAIQLKINGQVIACSATGSGKTKTFVHITHQAIKAAKTVLILTESRKIFSQICNEFSNVEQISADVRDLIVLPNQIYIGMAQTLANRGSIVNQFIRLGKGLIVINDEAHIGTATKLLLSLKNSYIIGFTATPRWKEAKHLTDIYKGIVVGKQPQWLIENGYLSPYYHLARTPVDVSKLQIKNGEFTGASHNRAFDKVEVYKGLFEDLTQLKYYKCMIFCANKAHADKTSKTLKLMGVDNVVVHTSNDLAEEDLKRFEETNEVNVCVSVGMLTKGYDFPAVDLVILNRATTSLPLYLQMIGRGSRICKGKLKFTVVDYGNNFKRFGLWNIERDWGKLWNDIKIKEDRDSFIDFDTCDSCGFILAEKEPICPNCGAENIKDSGQKPTKEVETKSELIDLTDGYNDIRGKMISELSAKELKTYIDYTGQINTAIKVARTKHHTFFFDFCNYTGLTELKSLPIERSLAFEDFLIK